MDPRGLDYRIFVISDLHLGGRPADGASPGFQMCSPKGQARLAAFIAWARGHLDASRRVELVLAGDIVDFLAEEDPFEIFTGDDARARKKLARALLRTSRVWEEMRAFVAAGGHVSFMLGNHDIELCLPGPRADLLRAAAGDAATDRVALLDDGQPWTAGPAHVEHGNRYDDWNSVPYDRLHAARDGVQQGAPAQKDLGIPGSGLVIDLMNPLKGRYRFIDLLKPETKAMLPILAALSPPSLGQIGGFLRLWVDKTARGVARAFDPSEIGALSPDGTGTVDLMRDPAYALSAELAREASADAAGDDGEIGALPAFRGAGSRRAGALQKALRFYASAHRHAFTVDDEEADYLGPAERIAASGKTIVVMGHTHLAKRRPLLGGRATYFNTGTWADLMRLPPSILGADSADAQADLAIFIQDLLDNKLDAHVRQLPTFVQIDLGSGGGGAEIFRFGEDDRPVRVPSGWLWEGIR